MYIEVPARVVTIYTHTYTCAHHTYYVLARVVKVYSTGACCKSIAPARVVTIYTHTYTCAHHTYYVEVPARVVKVYTHTYTYTHHTYIRRSTGACSTTSFAGSDDGFLREREKEGGRGKEKRWYVREGTYV